MKISASFVLLLLTAPALLAADLSRASALATSAQHWTFEEPIPPSLKVVGKVSSGLAAEGPGAREGGKVARFGGGYLDAGPDGNVPGAALTVYLRVRIPDGSWTTSLIAKRGGHDRVNFNLFSVDLVGTPGGDIGFEVRTDHGFFGTSFPVSLISTKAWHDLAGRYDGRKLQLICDGKVMAETRADGILVANAEPLLIGAETDAGRVSESRIFRGDIEEAALWARALTDDELAAVMRQPGLIAASNAPPPVASRLENFREFHAALRDDPQRPRWHFLCPEEGHAMPFDPNGAIFWRGRYHLFYIFQRAGGVHCWGHASSIDLLHWRHHPTALDVAPGDPDRGIFSGNAFLDREGVPTIMYHGVNVGNCIAQSRDDLLEHWAKLATNPIVPIPKPGDPNHGKLESWDPHGWFEGGSYYAIFGGRPATLLKGPELTQLKYLHPFVENDRLSTEGDDISCPDFFPLGKKHVLVAISHQRGVRAWVGTWKDDHFAAENHTVMTYPGSSYFAPETLLDAHGRRILWGWVLDLRGGTDLWSGVLSAPRVLTLGDDDTLRIAPAAELEKLRLNPRQRRDLALDGEMRLADLTGDSLDLALEIQPGTASEVGVKVRCSPDGAEQTTIVFDPKASELRIDFSKSSLATNIPYRSWVINAPKDAAERDRRVTVQSAPLALRENEPLRLRVLLDRSMLEVFANGRLCLTQRIFPTRPDSLGVALTARGGTARVTSFEAWEMAATNPW